MVSRLFCFLCFTSPVSLTSFYTEDEPRRHTPRSSISFIISSCVRFCVISSYYLIADHHDVCLITDRLFEMEATLIKVLHWFLMALHVILINTLLPHSYKDILNLIKLPFKPHPYQDILNLITPPLKTTPIPRTPLLKTGFPALESICIHE